MIVKRELDEQSIPNHSTKLIIFRLSLAVRGFGSCLCFGLRVGRVAMASAKSMGENLSRLQCGGDQGTSLIHQPYPLSQVILFFSCPTCLRKRSLLPVEKLNKWACQSLLFIVVENLSRYTKGIGGNNLLNTVMFIKRNNRFDPYQKVFDSIMLVGRMDGIAVQAKAHQYSI